MPTTARVARIHEYGPPEPVNQTLLMISCSSVRDSAGVRSGVALSHDPPGREYVTQISNFVDADCDRSGREILPDVRNALGFPESVPHPTVGPTATPTPAVPVGSPCR